MRAFVYHGANSGSVEEMPDPVPADGELLVEVLVTGICGSDIHGYSGDTGRRFPGQVMGHEASGRVIDANGTPGWAEGDRLTFNPVLGCQECSECMSGQPNLCARRSVIGVNAPYTGSFAQRMTLPAWAAVHLPETVSDDGGAVVEPLAVGLHAVGQAEVHKGDHVAVLGAGMIGLVSAWAALPPKRPRFLSPTSSTATLTWPNRSGPHRWMPARHWPTPLRPRPVGAQWTA